MPFMKPNLNRPEINEGEAGSDQPKSLTDLQRPFRAIASSRGSALVIAIVLMLVASMLIVVGSRLLVTMNKQTQQQTLVVAEAENAARAGLVDAINWFRRKNGLVSYYVPPYPPYNPSTFLSYIDDAFAPTQNASTQDTMDATIGIVQQYPITGGVQRLVNTNNIWARYEVRKAPNPSDPAPPAPTPTIDLNKTVHDITGERITSEVNGEGLVWTLYSTGYIYINNDSTKPYNVAPNKVLATSQMSTEIRKLALNIPAWAAAIAPSMCSIHINGNGVVNALSGGSTYYAAAAAVTSAGCPSVSGSGKISPLSTDITKAVACSGVNSDPYPIFGMHPQDVKNLADFTGDATHPLIIAGSDKLSYFNGNLTFSPSNPVSYYQNQFLNNVGTGVIYVDNGNLTISPVSGTQTGAFFNGVIFCNGSVTIGEGNQITGCVMAVNGITVGTGAGGSTEKAYLNFSQGVINREGQYVAVYREDRSASHNFVGVPIQ